MSDPNIKEIPMGDGILVLSLARKMRKGQESAILDMWWKDGKKPTWINGEQ